MTCFHSLYLFFPKAFLLVLENIMRRLKTVFFYLLCNLREETSSTWQLKSAFFGGFFVCCVFFFYCIALVLSY